MRRNAWIALVAAAFALTAPATANATEQTLTFTYGPVKIGGHGVSQGQVPVESPRVDGHVVGMEAEIVDAQGRVQGSDEVMLHHVVFLRTGEQDITCLSPFERFWAKGEQEVSGTTLPPGYGYANRGSDRWFLVYMLMNHSKKPLTGFVRYRVRYVTGEPRIAVRPLWLDVRNCRLDPVFDVPGTGGLGSTFTESAEFRMPFGGRLVGGGGHLHGGGVSLDVHNVTCATTPFSSLPTWGGPEPLPLLHEPGPVQMSSFWSTTGIAVAPGDVLRLSAVYDNSRPHTRVMGIMLLWLAVGPAPACEAPPPLNVDLGSPGPPPIFGMPLPRQPRGRLATNLRSTWVGDYRFGHERVRVRRGTAFTWKFVGRAQHDVTLVNGPVGFSSPAKARGERYTHRFTRRGRYDLFCSLHPAQMVQRIDVR